MDVEFSYGAMFIWFHNAVLDAIVPPIAYLNQFLHVRQMAKDKKGEVKERC